MAVGIGEDEGAAIDGGRGKVKAKQFFSNGVE